MSHSSTKNQEIDATALLSDLIKCPSVTPNNAGVLEVVETFLKALGFETYRLEFSGDGSYEVDNLFAIRKGKNLNNNSKHLLFGGHTDVVPIGDETHWTHPPFSAHIENGELWGRGAVDMKSGVAAFCAAIKLAIENGSAESGTISLAITNDEEADAINGTEKILKWASEQGHKFDFSIVGEPSSAKKLGDKIKIGRRGSFDGYIVVRGKQGHIAYPEKCINPIPVLVEIALAISNEPLDEGNEHFQASNLEISTFDVGNRATNVIPAEASLRFNVRHNDIWTREKLLYWVQAHIDKINNRGTEILFESPTRGANCFIFPAGDAVALLDEIIEQRTGKKPEHSTTGGTSDARFIAKLCPVVECGLVGNHMHAVDERVPISEIEGLTEIYTSFIARYFAN
ncbi:MAG: succinyl-diaminopimelate desuccinylase [Devosiaceae bacterium]|nr:succinyl-diaminopimelate desuccinylase [Devosiaceae bacterium]